MKYPDIDAYNNALPEPYNTMSNLLRQIIDRDLEQATSKIWHAHPVWFIEDNPIVGYSLQKAGLRLMFWSGADFNEEKLKPSEGKFKDASIFYHSQNDINELELKKWLKLSKTIQWDYKNIVKRKGQLLRLK